MSPPCHHRTFCAAPLVQSQKRRKSGPEIWLENGIREPIACVADAVLARMGDIGVCRVTGCVVEDEFRHLMSELRSGKEEAAFEIVRRYGDDLLVIVRRRLGRELRKRFESVDLTQNVWTSFFADLSGLEGIDTPEALAGFLAIMVRNKVIGEVRRHVHAAKREIGREEYLETAAGNVVDVGAALTTPSKLLIAEETWDRLCETATPQGREILELRRSGLTLTEIAERLDISSRTVRRILKHLKAD